MRSLLVILVGLPGSGKSTYARKVCNELPNHVVYEADMYFQDGEKYNFDPTKLGEAHFWCIHQVEQALIDGKVVYVANTNLTTWERAKYIELAKSVGDVDIQIYVCTKNFGNIHNVPEEKIAMMKERYEAPSAKEFEDFEGKWLIGKLEY